MELEGDPGLGKLMVIGKNPFPTFSPARNGHQRIRRVHNEAMLCGCKKSIENSEKVMDLNLMLMKFQQWGCIGENYDSDNCDMKRKKRPMDLG
jgi:hypothetical protein